MEIKNIYEGLNSHVESFDAIIGLDGKDVQITECIGINNVDLVFKRIDSENSEFTLMVNGKRRGRDYTKFKKIVDKLFPIENIQVKCPFDECVFRLAVSESPPFVKVAYLGVITDSGLNILDMEKTKTVCQRVGVQEMPIIYDGKLSKKIIDRFLDFPILGSKNKVGLIFRFENLKNTVVVLFNNKVNKIATNDMTSLVEEFVNLSVDAKEALDVKKGKTKKEEFIRLKMSEVKDNASLELYVERCVEEALVDRNVAETKLIESLNAKLLEMTKDA